ncbi:2-dehydropantoate 2-reductase N-terminal domain-containing protein [Paractinoplanes atraurantiacus]|uniref:Ketopantoate reductase PanE/ApbA n=1 Tax=Paractinoplanes atraurantiacus TaxID=1036182 RepID=A0A285HRW2_9ACTN|nr:2-dehydropantoate 2-reductase N-terminal domain-containing protein [Actinoplanes atraurantiacus]SNY38462.1 Ketopantoate reductase PanE/ApbA [Actinoplanes atraurantiacus]
MTDNTPSFGIVGAGSVGVNTAYDLIRAGAKVTFLVRPHRQEQLARPQAMFSYATNTLDRFSGYDVITDAAELASQRFDFLIVTLDNASLRAEAGLKLVKEIGRAFRGTNTGVILGAVGIGVRSWFIAESGLSEEQVAMGNTGALIHEVAAAGLPVDPSVDADLLAQADYAFKHLGPAGFTIDDSSPKLAEAFTAAYSGNGIPAAAIMPAAEMAIGVAILTPILAWELLGWQPLDTIDASHEAWQLGVAATREIQRLSVFGPTGQAAAEQTTPEGLLEMFRQLTQLSKPLDFAAFNAYHHGGKVHQQDLDFLDDARSRADAEGTDVPALRELISRLREA